LVIDRTHKDWAIGTGIATLVAIAVYAFTARSVPLKPYGGTAWGILLGASAFALMLFAALLGLRKRFLGLRIGRLHKWMRGHLWLGLLTVPLVLLHASFQAGGTLTMVLLVLTLVVGVSGVAGALLQHIVPRILTREVTMETVFEQIPHIREQMRDEGQALVVAACAPQPAKAAAAQGTAGAAPGGVATATIATPATAGTDALQHFWEMQLAPFLIECDGKSMLASQPGSEAAFRRLRTMLPSQLHPTVEVLESLAEEGRQLKRQETIHYWLHGWLFVHVPLSYALLALATVHAWKALRY
jgi:hypothetical protein